MSHFHNYLKYHNIKKCSSPDQISQDLLARGRDATRLIWNGKSALVLWGKRLLTHHRSIYTGLSFSHNPPDSTRLGLEGCHPVEGMLNSTHSNLAASCGSPFPKLTSPALPGGFLWHTEQPSVRWCVAMWHISTVHVLCSAAGNHITDYTTWYITSMFPLNYRTQVENITWKLILVWWLGHSQWSVLQHLKYWLNNQILE